MITPSLSVLALLCFGPMLVEAGLSTSHERVLRRQGAVEPRDDVFGVMQFAYPLAFVIMLIEAYWRDAAIDALFLAGAALFAAAKALKYWAIATLGPRWTFRVLVPKQSVHVTSGPYVFMRHPNYLGVMGELLGVMLMARAWIAGPIATIGFGLLLLARIRVEERALGLESRR